MAVRISRRSLGSRGGWVVDKDRCVGFRRVELTTRVLSVGGGCFDGDGKPRRGNGRGKRMDRVRETERPNFKGTEQRRVKIRGMASQKKGERKK